MVAPRRVPEPKGLDETQIAALELDYAGWNEMYLLEQAGLNRPHVVEFCHVKRVNPLAQVKLVAPDVVELRETNGAVTTSGENSMEEVIPNPANLAVAEIQALSLSPNGWARLLKLEQAQPKPRKSLVEWLRERAG